MNLVTLQQLKSMNKITVSFRRTYEINMSVIESSIAESGMLLSDKNIEAKAIELARQLFDYDSYMLTTLEDDFSAHIIKDNE